MFIKICGITSEDDALFAVAMGADAVGFVFAPSKRQIAPKKAYDITRRLPPEILTVGVFRNEHPDLVIRHALDAGVKAVQLHGRETPAQTQQVAKNFRWVIKAFGAGSDDLQRADEYGTDMILVDAPTPGGGKVFDWGLTGDVPSGLKMILAGGLNPDNVGAAIEAVEPWGVDVSSGVESAPGKKDATLVRRFIQNARSAAPEPYLGDDAFPLRLGRRMSENPAGFDAESIMCEPSATGRFGEFGGRFVPETLIPACAELDREFRAAWADTAPGGFRDELATILRDYAGRPSLLTECFRLSEELGVRVLLKREDLNHTGSHKINNVLGQALLAKRMGKRRLVAETGAGQHGVATATAAALMGLDCKVYMGAVDVERQALNVFRMRLLGAEVEAVESGSRTLKDAVNEAMRDWVATVGDSAYCLGSVMGPHPYPWMVRQFHRVIGDEAREQCRSMTGDDPDVVVACVGGGSNAIGVFSGFVDTDARLVGVEPAGGAAVAHGVPGVVHGMRSYLMQDEYGQVEEALSISAGLDYPGVGPEHSYLSSIGRAEYPNVTDDEVVEAFQLLAPTEGIIPALESAHAVAWLAREANTMTGQTVVVNLSGRGDKDVAQMMDVLADVFNEAESGS